VLDWGGWRGGGEGVVWEYFARRVSGIPKVQYVLEGTLLHVPMQTMTSMKTFAIKDFMLGEHKTFVKVSLLLVPYFLQNFETEII
jgi:hypothetical protein